MSRNKKTKRYVYVSVVIIFIIATFLFVRILESRSYKRKGSVFIESIEEYKSSNGILPKVITECGLPESMGEGPYYEKLTEETYIVYFNIGFDDAIVYYSDTRSWENYFRAKD